MESKIDTIRSNHNNKCCWPCWPVCFWLLPCLLAFMEKYLPFCLFLSGKIFTFQNRHNLVNGQLSTSSSSKESILLLDYSLWIIHTCKHHHTQKGHHFNIFSHIWNVAEYSFSWKVKFIGMWYIWKKCFKNQTVSKLH